MSTNSGLSEEPPTRAPSLGGIKADVQVRKRIRGSLANICPGQLSLGPGENQATRESATRELTCPAGSLYKRARGHTNTVRRSVVQVLPTSNRCTAGRPPLAGILRGEKAHPPRTAGKLTELLRVLAVHRTAIAATRRNQISTLRFRLG